MKNRIGVLLDTNVLLVSISSKSKYHWIYQKLIRGDFDLFITNEILTEYEEIVSPKYSPEMAKKVIRLLLLLPNVYEVEVHYNWNLIKNDPDDNKFVDCSVAAGAHAVITHDKDFDVCKETDFPKINILTVPEFQSLLTQLPI